MPRNVIVTGGTSGIGRAIAARFAAAGDIVIITGRNEEKLRRASDDLGVTGVRCDASNPTDVAAMVSAVPERVDVLVNAVGANVDTMRPDQPAPALDDVLAAWRANLSANLLGAVLTTTALLPRFGAGSTILTIGSEAAEMAATSYGAAKAALAAWTSGLSMMVGPRGMTANTMVPGYTEGTDFYASPLPEAMRENLIATTHTRRAGRPEDVAGLAFFLASADARHITGQAIHVSGGTHPTR